MMWKDTRKRIQTVRMKTLQPKKPEYIFPFFFSDILKWTKLIGNLVLIVQRDYTEVFLQRLYRNSIFFIEMSLLRLVIDPGLRGTV